jgi:hypothetical protein
VISRENGQRQVVDPGSRILTQTIRAENEAGNSSSNGLSIIITLRIIRLVLESGARFIFKHLFDLANQPNEQLLFKLDPILQKTIIFFAERYPQTSLFNPLYYFLLSSISDAKIANLPPRCIAPRTEEDDGKQLAANALLLKSIIAGDITSFFRSIVEADLSAKDDEGRGPLYLAANQGHKDFVKHILTRHVDVNATTNLGECALATAARCGYLDIVIALLESGATIDIQDLEGNTALIAAVRANHEPVTLALLEWGANPLIVDNNGKDANEWAFEMGHDNLIELLMRFTDRY